MFNRNKVEVIPWQEHFTGSWAEWEQLKKDRAKAKRKETIAKLLPVGVATHMVMNSTTASASTGDIIMKAFSPVVDLLQGISYPVAFIMITGGFLLIMTGQTSRGMHFIKWACLGYLGLQFAPAIMQIVVQIGQNIQAEVGAVN